ncbi:tRNA-uridine aminocarboxypropyltransferase [Heracleum sosnowskyi]|uniref:tRNA-uridine aminocarboxypropyltransferase n=1 Tax=Heracleum sosnowskyi TaxID=360622 RepID=A0AAD8H6P0_9APIA|nr:tRNA-uridine aminocarboxypropyltransferase [Heracleum sosnowskyi]
MGTNSKRPMCPCCSKPTRTCLCNRFKTPILENAVAVTILQHILEKDHPLNSARIAILGLQNLSVEWISDVNFQAHFDIRMFRENDLGKDGENSRQESCLNFGIEKHGVISSFNRKMVLVNGKEKVDFDHLVDERFPVDAFEKGFVVKKVHEREFDGESVNVESEMEVPAGSVLLFPSEKAIGPEEIDFEVKNLIVLDGTWAKAKRMYNENPWLKSLPHLKLDLDKAEFAVGENSEALDGLLDVFASMVGDQRRCKDERLSTED